MSGARPAVCPACGSRDLVPIVYGLPSTDLMAEARAGRFELGGCLVASWSPDHRCRACGEGI